jgi:hypothetical protein
VSLAQPVETIQQTFQLETILVSVTNKLKEAIQKLERLSESNLKDNKAKYLSRAKSVYVELMDISNRTDQNLIACKLALCRLQLNSVYEYITNPTEELEIDHSIGNLVGEVTSSLEAIIGYNRVYKQY